MTSITTHDYPMRGDVLKFPSTDRFWVCIDAYHNGCGWLVFSRELNSDGTDNINGPVYHFYTKLDVNHNDQLKLITGYDIVGKMVQYKLGDAQPFEKIPDRAGGLGELSEPPLTLAHLLPDNHVLSELPYWNDPNGRNGSAVAVLEWCLALLQLDQGTLPCVETQHMIDCVTEGLSWAQKRTILRIAQGCYGTMKSHISE